MNKQTEDLNKIVGKLIADDFKHYQPLSKALDILNGTVLPKYLKRLCANHWETIQTMLLKQLFSFKPKKQLQYSKRVSNGFKNEWAIVTASSPTRPPLTIRHYETKTSDYICIWFMWEGVEANASGKGGNIIEAYKKALINMGFETDQPVESIEEIAPIIIRLFNASGKTKTIDNYFLHHAHA